MKMKRALAITVLSLSLIIPANIAMAAPGLNGQIKINQKADKIATKTCGKYSKKMTKSKADCRFKVLTKNGFIPLYDFDLGGPDVNTFEYKGLNPYAPPASDAYATMK